MLRFVYAVLQSGVYNIIESETASLRQNKYNLLPKKKDFSFIDFFKEHFYLSL